tara:strand:+ start:360 stop:773 length:414 start_codon:yes stop_codon:yes gene_type:complete
MNKIDKLKSVNSSHIGLFNLNNKSAMGKVVKIFGANTVQLIFGLNNLIFKFNCKLVDTKLNSSSSEYNLSKLVSNTVSIENNSKILKIICNKFDVDGFLLVELMDEDASINKTLVENGQLDSYLHSSDTLFDFNSAN